MGGEEVGAQQVTCYRVKGEVEGAVGFGAEEEEVKICR